MLKMVIKYFTPTYNDTINSNIERALNLIEQLLEEYEAYSIKFAFDDGVSVSVDIDRYQLAIEKYLKSTNSITVQKGTYAPWSSAIGGYLKGKIYSNWRILKNYSLAARCGHYCHEGIHSLGEVGRHTQEWTAIRKYSASYFVGYFVKYVIEHNFKNVTVEKFLIHLRDKIK